MRDLLAEGSAWLERQRTKHLSRTVTYRRGGESVEVRATVGKTVFQVDKGYGLQERYETRDYLILAADLALSGVAILPKPGDRVLETDAGKCFVYEVMAVGNEPCWRYSDPYRRTLRMHTKLVATEVLP
ncbi:MAG: hypothetical protein HS116_18615 [Planctomycetes bacterium]|nr:hypothetical protein [Planctomycetota bacterium]